MMPGGLPGYRTEHYGAPPFDTCECFEHRRIRALESEKAALEIRAKELEVDAETWRTVHRRQLNPAEQAEADIAAFEAAMAEARTEIESDPRYRPDDPAQVHVNAPLALIQVGMESKIMLLNFLKRAAGRESATRSQPERAGQDTPARSGVGATAAAAKPAARCADCDGMGRNLAHPEEPCPACGGSGRLVVRLNREQAKAFFKVLSDASVADPDDERECAG